MSTSAAQRTRHATTETIGEQRAEGAGSPLYKHVVADARRALTLGEIGAITGVGDRAVQNWARGTSRPDGSSRDRLLELKYVIDQLSDVYVDEGIEIWLHAPQRIFGGERALDLLREGRFEQVLAAVERLAGGPRD